MKFSEALEYVGKKGHRVFRNEAPHTTYYLEEDFYDSYLIVGIRVYNSAFLSGGFYPLFMSDLKAEDWQVELI